RDHKPAVYEPRDFFVANRSAILLRPDFWGSDCARSTERVRSGPRRHGICIRRWLPAFLADRFKNAFLDQPVDFDRYPDGLRHAGSLVSKRRDYRKRESRFLYRRGVVLLHEEQCDRGAQQSVTRFTRLRKSPETRIQWGRI